MHPGLVLLLLGLSFFLLTLIVASRATDWIVACIEHAPGSLET